MNDLKPLTKELFLAGAKFYFEIYHQIGNPTQYYYKNGVVYSLLDNSMLEDELSYSSMYDVDRVNNSGFVAIDYFCGSLFFFCR